MDGRRLALAVLGLALTGCGLGSPELRSIDGAVLAPCDRSRCVSSQAQSAGYFVEPLRYAGSREAARAGLLRLISEVPGARIEMATPDYIHASFTSPLMRYVDDMELLFPPGERLVHLRSASRIGYYELQRQPRTRRAAACVVPGDTAMNPLPSALGR